jgi:acyl-CoA thioester hydrolase
MRFDIPEQKILVHELPVPIFWGDMDSLAHVNNTVYFRYMEQARVSWIQAIGGRNAGDDEGPVIANTFCNFYRPLVFPGQVMLRLYVANPGRTSIDTYVSIERVDTPGEVYAQGGATLVWVGLQDGRPRPLPDFIRVLAGQPALEGPHAPPALPGA